MNWAYISGFTDGEGCIHYNRGRNQWHITIAQAVRDTHVLGSIHKFLSQRGIRADLRLRKSKHIKHRDTWDLRISGAAHILKFLLRIRPFAIVKHREIDAAIEFNRAVLERKRAGHRRRERRLELVAAEYKKGLSITKLALKHKVCQRTIHKYFAKIGLRRRSQLEGISAFWSQNKRIGGPKSTLGTIRFLHS